MFLLSGIASCSPSLGIPVAETKIHIRFFGGASGLNTRLSLVSTLGAFALRVFSCTDVEMNLADFCTAFGGLVFAEQRTGKSQEIFAD